MTQSSKTRVPFCAILVAAAGAFAFAQAPIRTCPVTLSSPGNYELTADLTCAGPNAAISITSSGVSLRLNGHKILATSGDGIDVVQFGLRLDHVVIQGPGLITISSLNASAYGINFQNTDYSQVSQVTTVGAFSGVFGFLCNFLTIGSNVMARGTIGVGMNRSNSIAVAGNDTSGNTDGISFFVGSGNTINNNTSNGNSNSGIYLVGSPSRVYGNVTNGNGQYGIYNQTAGGSIFSNRSAEGNGAYDLYDVAPCSAAWSDNVFQTSNGACIR